MNLNNIVVAGRLGADPELKTTNNGKSVSSFSIATNRTWKDQQGNKQEQTEWISCVAWGRTAEVISQYFKKGKEIYIEGRLQTRMWKDKNDIKHYKTDVIVSGFQFVGYDNEKASSKSPARAADDYDRQAADMTRELNLDDPNVPPIEEEPMEEVNIEDIPF